ncbi:MAG: tRNA lysidine(34) synthetase TilS [bacterium]|nr:tRNA lysidine(34) synthetase TilS [bacterium]
MAISALETQFRKATAALVGDVACARFGVAVSGGPDSMALLDLAARALPGRVAAVTVDHGLRTESASEAAMVADWCAGRGITHAIVRPERAVQGNIQGWARTQRYALIEAWRAATGLDWIMTAHHADDQLETMLMRLNRGSGVNGLAGVRARTGHVIRPLLAVSKAQLQAYVDGTGIPYVVDPSNSDPRFDRAALRMVLADVDWLDPQAAARSAAALADAEVALDWMVEGVAAQHMRRVEGGWVLDRTDLPRELLRRLVLRMLAQAGAAAPRGDAIDRALLAAARGEQVSLGDWLLKGGAQWTLAPAPARRFP